MNDDLGKKAEKKIQEWLDKPNEGYCFDRIPDQVSGFYGSKNICDFTLFYKQKLYYIESKATWSDRFDFSMITEYQYEHLLQKSKLVDVYGIIVILFASQQRAFALNIKDIQSMIEKNKKSLNITKIAKWNIPYSEIQTIPNNRKVLLDYTGDWSLVMDKLFTKSL